MLLVVLFIASPLVIQTSAYFGDVRRLSTNNQLFPHILRNKIFNVRVRQKKRIVKIFISADAGFSQVCYVPRGVIMVLTEFSPQTSCRPEFMYVHMITLAMF